MWAEFLGPRLSQVLDYSYQPPRRHGAGGGGPGWSPRGHDSENWIWIKAHMCIFLGKRSLRPSYFPRYRERGTDPQKCSAVRLSGKDAALFQEADPLEC